MSNTICDQLHAKYGDICEWLTCDSYFHLNTCLLQKERRRQLYDRIEALGFEFPIAAYFLHNDACRHSDECYTKIDRSNHKELVKDEEGFDMTAAEENAMNIVKKELEDDEHVKELYAKAKQKYIEHLKSELKKQEELIGKVESEKTSDILIVR